MEMTGDMYYPDLSKYEYIEELATPDTVNVGWLDIKHAYPTKEPSEDLLNRLFQLCLHPINPTRGYHQCEFCSYQSYGLRMSRNGQSVTLGSAEIRVQGLDEIVYAAPNLIYHYVETHKYCPPDEFIEACLK